MSEAAKFALYQDQAFARNWSCDHLCFPKSSGRRLNHCFPRLNAANADARQRTIVWYWKEFFGFSKPARGGATYQKKSALAVASAGNDYAAGTSKASGCAAGASSYRNWTSGVAWIGKKVSWTGVLLPPKRGRRNRQNQAWKGHKVDGGGRRSRCSAGKPIDQRLARRSAFGRVHTRHDFGPARRAGTTTKASPARHRRPRLRQRSLALAADPARHAPNQSAPQKPACCVAQRRSHPAPLPQALEGRTHFRLVGKLSETGRSLRPHLEYVSHFLSSGLCADHLAIHP